jgi:hypothetical protein
MKLAESGPVSARQWERAPGKPSTTPWEDSTMAKTQQSYQSGTPVSPRRVPAEEAREQARRAVQVSMDTRQ